MAESPAPAGRNSAPGRVFRRFAASSGGLLLVLLIALAVMTLLALLLSSDPGRTLTFFFLGPLRNTYYFGNMLNSAIPLIFGGLGVSIAMLGGNFNLGGEGQVYTGAFVTTITALALSPLARPGLPGIPAAILALGAGAFLSGSMAGLSAFLKVKWRTNELITSFLLSNAMILIVNYCVTGPFLDLDTNLQSTRKVAPAFRLPLILPPSNLSAALFFALIMVVLVRIFLFKTRAGYEIRLCGLNDMFAKYGGINTGWNAVLSMFLSGALYGLGGGMAIFGTYYGTIKEFSSGMGWNGLAVALIARSSPGGVIPAAIFFAWIGSGVRMAMQFSDVTIELASIVQSVVFFLVTSRTIQGLFRKEKAL
ncbi:MAG: ABC transporter permease [Spirochaetaceae bacterium]|jgi:simple sugar transport system permease protein|nr:ABC transporter permease [Spirochaetaceae bacterium]